MSFFSNLFGGSSDPCNVDGNCECNQELKDHLRKCAGYGERPPIMNCCDIKCADPCKQLDLSGPPTCSGCTEAPQCCPAIKKKELASFCPKCEVPATSTFKCPEGTCDIKPKCKPACEPKPACPCPPPPEPKPASTECPASKRSCGCKSKSSSGGSWCGNADPCEPRPLKM